LTEPTNHELATEIAEVKKQHAVLEEKMNTSYERMNAAFERLRTDMAKRDNRLIFSMIGIMVAGITILGFILTSNPTP